jgi:hypothetical protein
MNSEMIAARLAEAEPKLVRFQAELDTAREELEKARLLYAENPTPATKSRFKGARATFQGAVDMVEFFENEVAELCTQLAEAQENEANEELTELLVDMAIKANYEYSAFLQARQDASDMMVQAARRMQDISSALHQTRNDFLLHAGAVANMSRDRKSPESDALRAELEKRVGDLSGLTVHWAGMEHAWSEPVRFEPLPLDDMVAILQRAKLDPEASDEPQWAESEAEELAVAEMA